MFITPPRPWFAAPALAAALVVGTSSFGAEWQQYNGPTGNRQSSEKILKTWPAEGLKTLWKVPMNAGFSSLTVSGNRAFTMVKRSVQGAEQEVVVALNSDTGQEQWATPIGVAQYDGGGDDGAANNRGGDGPRSTPSCDGNRVYVYSGKQVVLCLDAASGKEIWKHDVVREFGGKKIQWDSAASPLIEGDFVYVVGGGSGQSLLAFNKNTGEVAWKGESDGMTHSTPIATTLHGVRQVIFFTQQGLVATQPATGKVLWRQTYPFRGSTAISPAVTGNMIYVSAAYNQGAGVYEISKNGDVWSSKEVWRKPNQLQNHWGSPVALDGYVYGIFNQAQHARAPLMCIEVATGKEMWSKPGIGMGGLILVDGCLLVLADNGDLVLLEATPKESRELARTKVLAGKCWSTPTLTNGRLYVRSTKEGACLDLAPRMASR